MKSTIPYQMICAATSLDCESLLALLHSEPSAYSRRTRQVLEECAGICRGAGEALGAFSINRAAIALLCVGICEECAEVCDRYATPRFRSCAAACRQCADVLGPLAQEAA